MLACRVIGSPATVRRGLKDMIERTIADELMIVSDIFDPQKRLRSFEIIADATGSDLRVRVWRCLRPEQPCATPVSLSARRTTSRTCSPFCGQAQIGRASCRERVCQYV